MTDVTQGRAGNLPDWVPEAARHYLEHTEAGRPIRELARRAQVHASTILRQVRRYESLRDDPLVDDALRRLSQCLPVVGSQKAQGMLPMVVRRGDFNKPFMKDGQMKAQFLLQDDPEAPPSEARVEGEALRILRRLTEAGAVLAVARDMEIGVVVRDGPAGGAQRTGTVAREIAQAMALKDWIACAEPSARIARYHITAAGRTALRRLMAEAESRAQAMTGFAEGRAVFEGANAVEDDRVVHLRSILPESPLVGLARRRDRDGKPFLPRDLVAAGEKLREDFELSQMGPRVAQNWDSFLTGRERARQDGRAPIKGTGAQVARDRVVAALADLGPGLGDVALRCCCYLEGMEALERRMGWSARSGKIVLRIALQRLRLHYDETQGAYGPKIG